MYRRCCRFTNLLIISLVANAVMFGTWILYFIDETKVSKSTLPLLRSSSMNQSQNELQPSVAKEMLSAAREMPRTTVDKPTLMNRTPRQFNQSNLTILLFNNSAGESDKQPFNIQLQNLKKKFPFARFLWNKKKQGLGATLNYLTSQVKTEYFLFLEPRVSLSNRPRESITFLWDALEQFPELDFVGGSYLSHSGKLRVPCHRFRLCRWTFSESYEYERSLDNLMICEGISLSFMARSESVKKVTGKFDANIPDILVVKEFFLRAKSNNIVAGTRPNVWFLVNQFTSLYKLWNSRVVTRELVPFAVKHKVFLFKDIDGNVIEICSPTSPLSGKDLCIEQNSHQLMLGGGHWAFKGLFTYPYLLKYLEVTLSEVAKVFKQHNTSYFVEGGISLGAIKMRSILPWDSGDVDILVHDTNLDKLYKLFKPLADEKGYILRQRADQIHLFCTPRHVGDLSGGIATIFPVSGKAPPRSEFIEVETNGMWIRYRRSLIYDLINAYSKGYLEQKLHGSMETMECKIKGYEHNACMPNFKTLRQGKAGIWREYFCEI